MTRPGAILTCVLLVVAAPLGVTVASNAVADALGRNLGMNLARALAELPSRMPEPSAGTSPPVISPALPAVEELPERPVVDARTSPRAAKSRRSKASPTSPLGVRVRSEQVFELAERRALPGARPVPAEGGRPAGLELHGVSGLGVGMRDGDVLTSVAGAEVTSLAAVTELVLRERARRAPEISAQFWRDGAPGLLVVEQPYLPAPTPQ